MSEHFGGGVADETQLVLVGGRHVLKQRGKGMAAAVGRVAMADDAVALLHGIVKADGLQSGVKCCPVVSETQASAGGADKHRPGGTTAHQPVNDGLDLGRDRDDTAAARLRLSAANKAPQSGVVVLDIQRQQLRGPEAEIALGHDVLPVGERRPGLLEGLHGLHGKRTLLLGHAAAHDEIFPQIQGGQMSGDGVLVEQAAEGLHVLPGALPGGAVIHALLQVVHVDVGQLSAPEGAEVLDGGTVTAEGGLTGPVGGIPLVVQLFVGDVPAALLCRSDGQQRQILQRLLFGAEAGLGASLAVDAAVLGGVPAADPHGDPCLAG